MPCPLFAARSRNCGSPFPENLLRLACLPSANAGHAGKLLGIWATFYIFRFRRKPQHSTRVPFFASEHLSTRTGGILSKFETRNSQCAIRFSKRQLETNYDLFSRTTAYRQQAGDNEAIFMFWVRFSNFEFRFSNFAFPISLHVSKFPFAPFDSRISHFDFRISRFDCPVSCSRISVFLVSYLQLKTYN